MAEFLSAIIAFEQGYKTGNWNIHFPKFSKENRSCHHDSGRSPATCHVQNLLLLSVECTLPAFKLVHLAGYLASLQTVAGNIRCQTNIHIDQESRKC
jgi:hypothetical protein